jgi:hypothetical protein
MIQYPPGLSTLSGITKEYAEVRDIFAKELFKQNVEGLGYNIIPNVKDRLKLTVGGDLKNIWQPYTCPFTPKGSTEFSEVWVETDPLKVEVEQCYDVFWPRFSSEQIRIAASTGDYTQIEGENSDIFLEYILAKIVESAAIERNEIIYKGDKDNAAYSGNTAYLKDANGFEKWLKATTGATSAVTKIDLTSVTGMVEKVKAVVAAGLANAAEQDVVTDSYTIQLNYNDVKSLLTELGEMCSCNLTINTFSNWTNINNSLTYNGYRIISTKQTQGTVIFGPMNNMIIATDLIDSYQDITLVNQKALHQGNGFTAQIYSNLGTALVLPELFTYGYNVPNP